MTPSTSSSTSEPPPPPQPHRRVVVVEHDPAWAARAAEAAHEISHALAAHPAVAGSRVHHIGSTAVPGLAAKPIIDLLLAVPDDDALAQLDAAAPAADALSPLGYRAHGEYGIPGRRYFTRTTPGDAGHRTHHLHAFVAGSPGALRHLAFRDYLRAHPDVAAAYGHVKQAIAARCEHDLERYGDGKHAFVAHHEAAALRWMAGRAADHDAPPVGSH